MNYFEVPISDDALRKACRNADDHDGGPRTIFLRKKDGERLEGIVRVVMPNEFEILLLDGGKQSVKYEEVLKWTVLTKVKIAKEYKRLADAIESAGGTIDE